MPSLLALVSSALSATFSTLWRLASNTPMLALHYTCRGRPGRVFVKCEQENLTGSVEDRLALYTLQKAYELGYLVPGDLLVEAAYGHAGVALAALGRVLGHPVQLIMPDWLSPEHINSMRSLGADITLISKAAGVFWGGIELAEDLAATKGVFSPRQLGGRYNAQVHARTTGPEIWQQLASIGRRPEAFVAGADTGIVAGVGSYLRSQYPAVRMHSLELADAPTHNAAGPLGPFWDSAGEPVPHLARPPKPGSTLQAPDGDARLMARQLATRLGLAVGVASGANVIGAIQLAQALGPEAVVVTLLSDSDRSYWRPDLRDDEAPRPGYLTPDTTLIRSEPIRRLPKPLLG